MQSAAAQANDQVGGDDFDAEDKKAALIAGVALGLTAVAGAPASAAAPSGEAGVLGGCSVFSPNTPSVVGNQIAGSALWDCALGPQEAAESNVRLYQDGNVVSEHKFWQQGAFRTTYTIGLSARAVVRTPTTPTRSAGTRTPSATTAVRAPRSR